MLAAEKLVDGDVQCFAYDVIEGNINCALGGEQDASAFKILAAIQLLPDAPALHGVLPDEKFPEMFDGANDRQLASAEPGFAQAINALVRFDLDDKLITYADPDGEWFDVSDFHRIPYPAASWTQPRIF